MKIGFDSNMYMQKQSEHILERISHFDKLYLEFGGKLFDDLHAARVLPGFDKAAKIKLLQKLRDKAELVICINANAIERNKIRADYGITYGSEVERMIDNISARAKPSAPSSSASQTTTTTRRSSSHVPALPSCSVCSRLRCPRSTTASSPSAA